MDITPCHAPAQDLLSVNEMREFASSGDLPENFRERVETAADSEELMTSPNVSFHHASPHPLTELLSYPEMHHHLAGGPLPADLRARAARIVTDDCCINCGGRQCMGCVFREFDHDCAEDCPNCCPAP